MNAHSHGNEENMNMPTTEHDPLPPDASRISQPHPQPQCPPGISPQPTFQRPLPQQFRPQTAPYVPQPLPTAPQPPARPGILGIWADPEKCDTSEWNTYFYFFRQVSQHMASIRFKSLKWIAIGYNLFYLLFMILAYLPVRYFLKDVDPGNFLAPYAIIASLAHFALLAGIPMVMLGQAFRIKRKKISFLASTAREPPLLSHLIEYTTSSNLVEGVFQSLIFIYGRMFLFMLPAAVISCILLAVFEPWALCLVFVFLLASMLLPLFSVMQSFCARLDTLAFFLMTGGLLFNSFLSLLYSHEEMIDFLGIFVLLPAVWAICMAYLPLAAADTLEYGIGKHARWIRLLQVFIVLAAGGLFLFLTLFVEQDSEKDYFFSIFLPALWCFAGVAGLLISSLAPASFRARNSFRRRIGQAKSKTLFLLFDPSSPGSLIPVCILEVAVTLLYSVLAKGPEAESFWTGEESSAQRIFLLIVMLGFSSVNFALALMLRTRRRSRLEKPAWRMHPLFSLLCFVFMIALSLIAAVFHDFIFFSPGFFIISCLCVILPTLREKRELRNEENVAPGGAEGAAP